jgi:uncharacterized protein YdaU (DUF1376 family)
MASEPWFKFYAADYLTDPDVDDLSLEAQAILLRIWCVCNLEGSAPANPKELARKTRLDADTVAKYESELALFFDSRDGRLHSPRMEEEKRKSEGARKGGAARGEQIRLASRSAECLAQSQSQSQSQSQDQIQSQTHPLYSQEDFALSLQKKNNYSQSDFDARDFRKLADARKKFDNMNFGTGWTEEAIIRFECQQAGITPARWHELEKIRQGWAEGASA